MTKSGDPLVCFSLLTDIFPSDWVSIFILSHNFFSDKASANFYGYFGLFGGVFGVPFDVFPEHGGEYNSDGVAWHWLCGWLSLFLLDFTPENERESDSGGICERNDPDHRQSRWIIQFPTAG